MSVSEKKEKMILELQNYSDYLRDNNDLYKVYYGDNVPEKIQKKLISNFDNHLPINSITAFFDSTLFSSAKSGLLFTIDGFYYKYIGKAIFFSYSDIESMKLDDTNLIIYVNNSNEREYTVITVFNTKALKSLLLELIRINNEIKTFTNKSSGKVKKIDLPKDIQDKCNVIIHTASAACGGVGTGLAQIPASDNAVIVPIQITMIISLGKVFDLNITESTAKSIIASAGASIAGRTLSQFLLGWIPGVGNAINTATAAGITEAIGWLAVKNFYDRWIQDMNKGRYEGMKDGYNEASAAYEEKLRKQAEEFLKQKTIFMNEKEKYEQLLDEYEKYIEKLETENASYQKIENAKITYQELRKLNFA